MLADFARHLHWTAADVLDGHTFAEFVVVWCGGGQRRGRHDPARLREQINRRRAGEGLPPMRAPTPDEVRAVRAELWRGQAPVN